MKYAIVQSGPRQMRAEEGQTLDVDRLVAEIGEIVELPVILLADGDEVQVGTPVVEGAKVKATVVEHVRGPKIRVFKYKPKVRYRRRQGHRQPYTRLRVEKIGA